MPAQPALPKPSRGPLRWLARLPLWLYRARLGWLLGSRFLVLTHVGRTTGRPRHTVLEIVGHDEGSDTYYVASGWGKQSDWYRNVLKTPEVMVQVGGRRREAVAEPISPEAAEQVLLDYARRHPLALKYLGRVLGIRVDGSEEDVRRLARHFPIVALRPTRSGS